MKVFVATEPNDGDQEFSFTIPGELVHLPPIVCACPECGCERAMAGFVSHRATTSFVVRDLDLDTGTYAALLFESLKMGGWVNEGSPEDIDFVRSWADEHITMASDLPTETPLQAHGDGVSLKPIRAR